MEPRTFFLRPPNLSSPSSPSLITQTQLPVLLTLGQHLVRGRRQAQPRLCTRVWPCDHLPRGRGSVPKSRNGLCLLLCPTQLTPFSSHPLPLLPSPLFLPSSARFSFPPLSSVTRAPGSDVPNPYPQCLPMEPTVAAGGDPSCPAPRLLQLPLAPAVSMLKPPSIMSQRIVITADRPKVCDNLRAGGQTLPHTG